MIASLENNSFSAKDGHVIRVRELRPDDAALLVEIFEHMSPDSRFKRYNQALGDVAAVRVWQEAIQIAYGDAQKEYGLIALTNLEEKERVPVGAARLVETGPGVAEVAISLRDEFQNLGIGTRLMQMLAEKARELGFRELTASIRNDNPAIWQVFNSLPFEVKRVPEGGFSEITVSLSPEPRV